MVRTMTSALSAWKNQMHTAPGRMRKAWRPGRETDGTGAACSEVTWQTVRDSLSIRNSMRGWR